jgi:3-hydroxyacyl-[acyl-carrier-protein] dehydratase
MSAEEIERAIPHRPPMRLLDEIVSRDESTIVCRKTFHAGDFFVQGHFPDYPLVPGVIQCECCLQAGAILLAEQTPGDEDIVPVATRMDSVKFKRMVRPGDTVEVHVTLKERVSNAYYLTGKMLLDGKVTARLDFACSVTNPREAASGQDSASGQASANGQDSLGDPS